MDIHSPTDLFFDQLRDLYSVEQQLSRALPALAAETFDPELRRLLLDHSDETAWQRAELEEIFRHHGVPVGGDTSKAMAGLIEGGNSHLAMVSHPGVRDLMMVAHCLRIEHYQMAAYEITTALASGIGFRAEAGVLGSLLELEEDAAAALETLEPRIFDRACEPLVLPSILTA